jgi:hypothetical protein
MNSIFSTYSQGENRVTSTIISVFEKLNPNTIRTIIQNILGDDTFELIKFENQVKKGARSSIPDAKIHSLFELFIETKIEKKSVDDSQINRHLEYLQNAYSKLLILTPDAIVPFTNNNPKIIWANFNSILVIIEELLVDYFMITERERFLLFELKLFIINSNLLCEDPSEMITIVPANLAWPEYINCGLYICQQNRSFRETKYLGFYANGAIQNHIPQILGYIDDFNLSTDDIYGIDIDDIKGTSNLTLFQERIKKYQLENKNNLRKESSKIFVLSELNSDLTLKRDSIIENDKLSKTGKNTAYIQNQTYLEKSKLMDESIKMTSQL